jgi:hypothetical protein
VLNRAGGALFRPEKCPREQEGGRFYSSVYRGNLRQSSSTFRATDA